METYKYIEEFCEHLAKNLPVSTIVASYTLNDVIHCFYITIYCLKCYIRFLGHLL